MSIDSYTINMKQILMICALIALTKATPIQNKIVGGKDAQPGQFKYIASLRTDYNNWHFCGATIISPRTLVTAAHCKVYDISYMVAVIGTTKLDDSQAKRYTLKEFITHPKYDPSQITNDIAVVILNEDIEFTDLVQPLTLTSANVEDGERLTSSGWGYTVHPGWTAPNDLQWMQMNVVNEKECQRISGETTYGKICTLESEGQGVCSGDSGGPLVNNRDELVGVTSSAFLCALGLPDFFTDVYFFKDWVLAHAQM